MQVKLRWVTPEAEKEIVYMARVSNPANQDNPEIEGLIKYCARNNHWSIFEMANACFEIQTSRAITAQILRHKSLHFQELSQRYAKVQSFEDVEVRRQDEKNRQNSIDDLPCDVRQWWNDGWDKLTWAIEDFYEEALHKGVAKECARMILPMASTSRIFVNGNIRSWIHYIDVRAKEGTQKEHRDVAIAIRDILSNEMPVIARAMEWNKNDEDIKG